MKVSSLLCIFFIFFVFFSLQAQHYGCKTNWKYNFPIANGNDFIGTGWAQTTITDLQGGGINGWVNYVVNGSSSATYTMTLTLGSTPYTIVYQGSNGGNGSLEVHVATSVVYSTSLTNPENQTVFRIAREGSVMRFYKDDALLPLPSTVNADMGVQASTIVSTDAVGRIHVTLFPLLCQIVVPEFIRTPIDCVSGAGTLSVSNVQGGSSPYFHYFDNINFNNILSFSSPRVGWITTVDQDYRAATYYMGVGKTITWQHTDTQLNGNVLTSLTSSSSALPSNILSSQEEGWVGFRKEMATGWSVAFVDATTSTSLYEFKAYNNIYSDIYIGGSYVTRVQALLTDYLRISKEGNSIKFYVNGVEVYSQPLLSSVDLKAKFDFTQIGTTISYPTLSFCALPPPVITLASTNLSACQYEDVPAITPTTQHVTELRWYTTNPDGVVPRPNFVPGFSFDPDGNNSGSLAVGTHTYYVTGIGLNGQETPSQAVTLTIHSLPTISIDPIPPLCPGTSAILSATSISGATYQWYKNNTMLINQTGSSLTITTAGIYKVEVSLPQGCIITKEYDARERVMPSLTLSSNGTGCGYTPLQVTISGGYTEYYVEIKNATTGNWTPVYVNGGTGSQHNKFTLPSQPSIQGAGIYRVYYEEPISGCKSYSNELAVTVNPLPQSTIYASTTACQNNPVTLTIHNYNSAYTYQWQVYINNIWTNRNSTSPTTLEVPYGSGTIFRVFTTNPITSCSNPSNTYTINYLPSPSISYTSFVEEALGETIDFDVTPPVNSNYIYQWTGLNGFTSTSANPTILINANSYGEYTLVVKNSNGSCPVTYRAILAEKGIYATLKENLDASYYHTSREGKLYFKFDEKYGLGENGTASISIFNYDFREVSQSSLSKVYGYNWYELDLSSFAAVVEGEHYILHIQDEWERRYVLRVKYATGNNKVIIGNDVTTCIPQSGMLRTVELEATSYVDIAPYSISWYVSTDETKINQLETLSASERNALLFEEKSNLEQQYSTALFSASEGTYYVCAKIKNYCNGEETYSDQVVIITINVDTACRIAELTSKEKHRFELFFSIRRLFSPKSETNPATR